MGGQVTLLLLLIVHGPNEETLQDTNQIEMPILVLGLLDRYQSFDARSPVLDDSVDQSQGILRKPFIRVDFVDDREKNPEKLLAVLILIKIFCSLTLLIEILKGSNSGTSSSWERSRRYIHKEDQ